jgi:hypothetical protein
VANIEGKLLAERAVHRWQDNIKMNLKYNNHGVGWVFLLRTKNRAGLLWRRYQTALLIKKMGNSFTSCENIRVTIVILKYRLRKCVID